MQFGQQPFSRFTGRLTSPGHINLTLLQSISNFNIQAFDLPFLFNFLLRQNAGASLFRMALKLDQLRADSDYVFTRFQTSGLQTFKFRNLCLEDQIFQIHVSGFRGSISSSLEFPSIRRSGPSIRTKTSSRS